MKSIAGVSVNGSAVLARLPGPTLSMTGIQAPSLAISNHFLFIYDLVYIRITRFSDYSDLIGLDIKDEVVLAHECPAH